MFAIAQEEGPAERLFGQYPAPPPPEIQNLATPPSDPGDPIEAVVFNAPN